MADLSLAADPEFLDAVHAGLSGSPKTLPCRFFYDLEGSLLFEQICELPEYYLTRTEDRILSERAEEIVAALSPRVDLVELGSGSSRKTRRLIEALLRRQPGLRYVPVDISGQMLARTARELSRDYPRLTVDPLVAEYGEALDRLHGEGENPRLVVFLGSNLGNFHPEEGVRFLRQIREMMNPDDRALLGLDRRKDRRILEPAYDDAAGVTARFNLNLLRRINRELGGTFDLQRFRHRAWYNEAEGRVEMHLVSTTHQVAGVEGRLYSFEAGESIHTENSYKYSPEQVCDLAAASGLALSRVWSDPEEWFSVNLFQPA